MTSGEIISLLNKFKLPLDSEKVLQAEIEKIFNDHIKPGNFLREHKLDDKSTIDFLVGNIGIEVKIKGSKTANYRQCVRYCDFESIHELILITNKATGFPRQ